MRVRAIEDSPTLIAELARPRDLEAETFQTALLQAAAAQASAQQQTSAPPPPDDVRNAPGEMPPMMIRPTFGFGVDKPKFSIKAGKVAAGTKIKLYSDTHYATLYYTTNGWTPTPLSAKYTKPIVIDRDTHLTVIAMGPNLMRSEIEHVDYTVVGSKPLPLDTTVTVPADGVLRAGTAIRLVFGGSEISSESASVGDEITLLTDEDIKLGDTIIAPKGTRVEAALVNADPQKSYAPGDLVFEVHSLEVKGVRIPLYGGETMEAEKHDNNAIIKPGMTAMAFVSADTKLK